MTSWDSSSLVDEEEVIRGRVYGEMQMRMLWMDGGVKNSSSWHSSNSLYKNFLPLKESQNYLPPHSMIYSFIYVYNNSVLFVVFSNVAALLMVDELVS